MHAHVFGGASSASFVNYALRRTTVDNIREFGKVHDQFKSVEGLATAKILVNNVINMCKNGGFSLEKFLSNSKEWLVSIPENRRTVVKNLD